MRWSMQKNYTRRERHAMLVRREKRNKQGHVTWFGRYLRESMFRSMRKRGQIKRARHARLISRLHKQYKTGSFSRSYKTAEMIENQPVFGALGEELNNE